MSLAVAKIKLPNGDSALVDAEDLPKCIFYRWQRGEGGVLGYGWGPKRGKKVSLHHLISGLPKGTIDHRDCNPLNNCKSNLRRCNAVLNAANRRKWGKRRFRGVMVWGKNKWAAVIKQKTIGVFPSEIQAAQAWNQAAIRAYGAFARLNPIPN